MVPRFRFKARFDMRALLIVVAIMFAGAVAAQPLPPALPFSSNSAPPTFSGGTLTAPLILDATNTLCSQSLSLSFTGDSDLGLQRAAANTLAICASSGVNFNGPIVVTQSGNVQTYIQAHTINGSGGNAARSDLYATILDSGNSLQTFLSVFGANFSTTFLGGKALLGTSALVTDLVISASDKVVISPASTGTGSASTEFLTVDIVSGTTGDVIHGDNAHTVVDGTVPTISGSSTCTSSSIASNSTDTSGSITAICTVGQTIILTFAQTFTTNTPFCVVGYADLDSYQAAITWTSGTTSAATFTAVVGDAQSGIFNYWCPETR